MSNEQWVSILVPKQLVREIYKRVLELPTSPGDVPAASAAGDPGDASWTIRRLYSESPTPLRRFLDLLASRPDEWVSTDEVMEATGLEPRKWPQLLSALARRWKRHGGNPGTWPYESQKTYGSGKQTLRYLMPGEYAEVIRSMPSDQGRG